MRTLATLRAQESREVAVDRFIDGPQTSAAFAPEMLGELEVDAALVTRGV